MGDPALFLKGLYSYSTGPKKKEPEDDAGLCRHLTALKMDTMRNVGSYFSVLGTTQNSVGY